MLELLINKQENLKTIMLVENGELIEKHEEHENQKRIEGNIYIGIVENVLKGMQSAFINIGEGKNSLIKLRDVLPKVDETDCNDEITDVDITKLLKSGDKILIQIKKDGTFSKGAKVTTHINLPGRFIALMPTAKILTVSSKIEDETERNRLKEIVRRNLPTNMGAIIRTASENVDEELIKKDIKSLLKTWNNIENKTKNTKQPILLYDNNTLIRRTVIDVIDRGLQRIIINDKTIYQNIKKILEELNAEIKIELQENKDLFDMYSIRTQIEYSKKRKIWLKCGGFITIDATEALTAIDVNTGKYTGFNNDREQTILLVNKQASVEIAKQLRLRDIGGIIVIDYIDMKTEEHKKIIKDVLEHELKKDRSKCQVEEFTKLNLLELTRKNMCNNDYIVGKE